MEMNILAGVLGGVAAVSLTANWLLWIENTRYQDLFNRCYQLAGQLFADEADDWNAEASADEALRLLAVLSDPDSEAANVLLRDSSLSSVVEQRPVEAKVVGSTPAAGANTDKPHGPAPSHEREPPTLWPPWF